MNSIEYVTFGPEYLTVFEDLILPNVVNELFAADNFEEEGYLAFAAVSDDVPQGVLVARILDLNRVDVLSIYVEEDARGQGIGGNLLLQLYDRAALLLAKPENSLLSDAIRFSCEYALEPDDFDRFTAFLFANGFDDISEAQPVVTFSTKAADRLPVSKEAEPLTAQGTEFTENLLDDMDDLGAMLVPELSYYTLKGDMPDCLVLTYLGEEDECILVSACTDDCTEEHFTGVAGAALRAIRAAYPDYTVVVNEAYNVYGAVFEKLAEVKIRHGIGTAELIPAESEVNA